MDSDAGAAEEDDEGEDEVIGARLSERMRAALLDSVLKANAKPRPPSSPGGSAAASAHKQLDFKTVPPNGAGAKRGSEGSWSSARDEGKAEGKRPAAKSAGGAAAKHGSSPSYSRKPAASTTASPASKNGGGSSRGPRIRDSNTFWEGEGVELRCPGE